MQHIQATFQGQGEITQAELANLKAWDIQILTAKGKHLTSIDLICGERNLRWLDLRDNQIDDKELKHLEWLKNLEVLLLDNNLITSIDGLLPVYKENKRLRILSVVGNPFASDADKVSKLVSDLQGVQVLTKEYNQDILELRRKCLFLQLKANQKDNELKQLKKQLFEDKSRASIDLGRYLINLKIYCSNSGELIHTLFSTLRKLEKQDPRIKEIYPNLPWNIIEEWPETNFLLEYKIDYSQVESILDHQSIQYSTSLDVELENLLNQYYALELQSLFKKCKANLSYSNLNKLLHFLLSTCKNYFTRSEEYSTWIDVTFPNPWDIKEDLLKYFLEGGVKKLDILQSILNKPKDDKLTQEQATLLNDVKKMSFMRVFRLTNKQAINKTFSNMILQFFQSILDLYTNNDNITSQNKQQNDLFSRFLFVQFNSSDVYYLSLLLREGQVRNQEYFIKNIHKLDDIISLKKWLQSIEDIEDKLKTMNISQLNPSLAVFFKKVLGRPEFNICVIKRFFHRFDFEIIRSVVDSYQRPQTIQLLSSRFGNDFSFIRSSIINRKADPKLIQMQKLLQQSRTLTKKQQQFVDSSITLFYKIQKKIVVNPLIENVIKDYPSSFSLLQTILERIPDSEQVQQIIQTTNTDKLYSLQNRYLLDMLRSVIHVSNKQIQLINRDKCWFANYLESLKNVKFYVKHEYIFDFIRLSYTLYQQNLNEYADGIPHKNSIEYEEISKTTNIKVYLQKINNKYLLSDYLLDICKKEIRQIVFDVEQGVFTFDMLKFKELAKDPACKFCFDKDFYEELDLISNTNGLYFVEITNYDPTKFDDKKLREALLEAYHEQVLLHCLKRELMNLGEYSSHLQKAQNLAKVKGFQLRLPLYQISKVVRSDIFQKSLFKTQLYKYLKSKSRTEADRKNLLTLFNEITKKLAQQEVVDKNKLEFIKEMFLMEQNKLCQTFIRNISLVCSMEFRTKAYPILDWNLLNSFAKTNHLVCWEKDGIEPIEERMTKYRRVLSRYLSDPFAFRGERAFLNRGIDKLQDLILNQQINAMLSQLDSMQGIDKKGLGLVLHRIHRCFTILASRGKVDSVQGFNYQLCLSVKKKLSHNGFLILTDYFANGQTSQNRYEVEEIIESIGYKIQYYKSLDTLKQILLERQYNPANYFKALIKTLISLSNINTLNTQIEAEFIRNRYPLFPWQFIVMAPALNPQGMWYRIFMMIEEEHGIYLQLLHYLDTRDETDGISILAKLFQCIYSNQCCNDLIKRVNTILPLEQQLKNTINRLILFKNYMQNPEILEVKINNLIQKQISKEYPVLNPKELLACLRVLSLKGEYINRIQKMSNKLRNMLCDYDETGLDVDDFLNSHKTKQTQRVLKQSLLSILLISLKYKDSSYYSSSFNFYLSSSKSSLLDKNNSKLIIDYLNTLNYKKQFVSFQQPDLHLKFIILSETDEVTRYFKNLIILYRSLIKDLSVPLNSEWQAAGFLHIAILTTIRLKNKYKMVVERYPDVEIQLLKQPFKVYRNHLAHFIPSQKTLAAKKLNINSLEEMSALYRRIDAIIQTVKL